MLRGLEIRRSLFRSFEKCINRIVQASKGSKIEFSAHARNGVVELRADEVHAACSADGAEREL